MDEGEPRKPRNDRRPSRSAVEVKSILERQPPNSLSAEMALLGAMIVDPTAVADVLPYVSSSDDFFSDSHGIIFRSILELYEKHQSADLVQLVEAVAKHTVIENIGGPEFLVKLAEDSPTSANAKYYAQIVAAKARLRQLIQTAGTIAYEAHNAGEYDAEGVRQIIDWAEGEIFKIAERDEKSDPQRLSELLMAEIERIERADGSKLLGLATGFHDLDDMLSGLKGGEMLILAGRPSMGKTAIALNMAEQIAFGGHAPDEHTSNPKDHVAVGIFSLEMSKEAVTQRLVSSFTRADSQKLRTGGLTKTELTKVIQKSFILGEAPIIIDDSPALTILGLRARARRMLSQHHIRCLVVDYLQLLTAPGLARESRQVEVSAISRGIKALARELNVPIICLAQLNRGSEQREGHRPRMSDLRESGSIEQDADVVMLIHREDYYHRNDPSWANDPENEDKVGTAELLVVKQRNGPTGVVKLKWDENITRFENRVGYRRDDVPDHFVQRARTIEMKPIADTTQGVEFRSGFRKVDPADANHPPSHDISAAALPREREDDLDPGPDDDFGDVPVPF